MGGPAVNRLLTSVLHTHGPDQGWHHFSLRSIRDNGWSSPFDVWQIAGGRTWSIAVTRHTAAHALTGVTDFQLHAAASTGRWYPLKAVRLTGTRHWTLAVTRHDPADVREN